MFKFIINAPASIFGFLIPQNKDESIVAVILGFFLLLLARTVRGASQFIVNTEDATVATEKGNVDVIASKADVREQKTPAKPELKTAAK